MVVYTHWRMFNDTFVVKTRAATLATTPRKAKAKTKEKPEAKTEKKKRIGKQRQR